VVIHDFVIGMALIPYIGIGLRQRNVAVTYRPGNKAAATPSMSVSASLSDAAPNDPAGRHACSRLDLQGFAARLSMILG